MTVKTLTAEGAAAGTAMVTGGNYGGSAIDLVSITGTGAMTVSSTAGKMARGTRSVRITTAANADTSLLRFTGFAGSKLAAHFTYVPDAVPTANAVIATLRHASGSIVQIQHTATTGKIRVLDSAGTAVWDSTPAYPTTGVPRISIYADRAAGTIKVAVYANWSDTTPISGASATLTGIALGANDFAAAQFGKITTTFVGSMYLDDVRVDDGATDLLPPESNNTAPTVNAGADQTGVEPWATVTLSATATDPDGTTPTVTWAQTGGSPTVTLSGSGSTRTIEAPGTIAGTTLTFTATASDGSLSATDAMTVAVLPATERAVVGGVEVPLRVTAVAAPGNPKMATLTDDFAAKDTAKWSWGPSTTVVGGRLVVPCTIGYLDAARSNGRYDLTNDSVMVEVVQHPGGPEYTDTYFTLRQNGGTTEGLSFDIESEVLGVYRLVGGGWTTLRSLPYDTTAHRWLRFRHAGSTVYWETSPDAATWTVLYSEAAQFAPTALQVNLGTGGSDNATPSSAIFDNLNVAPPSASAPTVNAGADATATTWDDLRITES